MYGDNNWSFVQIEGVAHKPAPRLAVLAVSPRLVDSSLRALARRCYNVSVVKKSSAFIDGREGSTSKRPIPIEKRDPIRSELSAKLGLVAVPVVL